MQTKLFEVRDRGTFIPVMATIFDGAEHPLLHAAGYVAGQHYVILAKLTGGDCAATYDPFFWPANPRTMREAHLFIDKTPWGDLKNGDVIDVEFSLGETSVKKESQLEHYHVS